MAVQSCMEWIPIFKKSYFYKILVEYYYLGRSQASEAFCSKFIRCQSKQTAKSQNFGDTLGPQKFLEFYFFFIWRCKIIDITREKSSWAHFIFKHKSCNEIVDNIVNGPKFRVKMKLCIFWLAISHFCFR